MQITRSFVAILTAAALSLSALPAVAAVKIAIVDVQTAIANSDQSKKLVGEMQKEFKPQQDQLRKIQATATALLEKAQKNGDVMSSEQKRRLQNEIESKNSDFEYFRQRLQKEVQERRQELFAPVDKEVQQAIEDLVREHNYDLVIPAQATLYVNPVYDVTNDVTEKLNEYYAASKKAKDKGKN